MAEALIAINDPALLESGIVPSLHKLQAPLWIDGQNVIFEDGSVQKSKGYVAIAEVLGTDPISGIQDILLSTGPNLCFGDANNLYRYDGATVTADGTGYTAILSLAAFQINAFQIDAFSASSSTYVPASLWSMANFGTWCFATNGVDPPQINKMAGAGFVDLTGTPPTRARIVVRYKNFIIFFNTTTGDNYAEWCDVDDPENFTTGAAGTLPIRDLDSEIKCVVSIGDALAIYSSNSMAIFQYIGPDYWFGSKPALKGIGATGIHSVVAQKGYNFGISKQGVWKTDSASYDYISPPFIRKWIQDNVNFSKEEKIAGYLNEDRSMVEWGVPVNGGSDNSITIGYNYQKGTWMFRSYGITCALKKNAFPLPVFGLADGTIHFGEYGADADIAPLEAWVQSKPLPGDNHLLWKDVEWLISYIRDLSGTGVYLYLGFQESLDDAIVWSNAITASEASNPQFIEGASSGRYISIKLYSNTLGSTWRLAGFDIWGVKTGADL